MKTLDDCVSPPINRLKMNSVYSHYSQKETVFNPRYLMRETDISLIRRIYAHFISTKLKYRIEWESIA